jgi:pimeloyl-ACP methyl ester carboxylesterase
MPNEAAARGAGVPGRALRLAVDGITLSVIDHSHGAPADRPPLLLLHGGMAHARWWDALAPHLVSGFRPFALDRRGHGDSDWADPATYGWARDLADIAAAMEALDRGPWVIAGHSQGGLIAADLAARGEVQLRGLVLLDTPLHPSGPRLRRTGESLRKVPQLRWSSLEQAMAGFRPFPAEHRVPADRLAEIARASFKPTGDGGFTSKFHWKIFQRDPGDEPHPLLDFAERLRAIRVPTLCLRGDASTILLPEEHREMARRIPRGEAVEIAGATHNLHAEQPEQVASALLAFARRL